MAARRGCRESAAGPGRGRGGAATPMGPRGSADDSLNQLGKIFWGFGKVGGDAARASVVG